VFEDNELITAATKITDTMPIIEAPSRSPDRPRQYNQPSRKGKKAWRKNVDVSEVEKGLEELNEEKTRL